MRFLPHLRNGNLLPWVFSILLPRPWYSYATPSGKAGPQNGRCLSPWIISRSWVTSPAWPIPHETWNENKLPRSRSCCLGVSTSFIFLCCQNDNGEILGRELVINSKWLQIHAEPPMQAAVGSECVLVSHSKMGNAKESQVLGPLPDPSHNKIIFFDYLSLKYIHPTTSTSRL